MPARLTDANLWRCSAWNRHPDGQQDSWIIPARYRVELTNGANLAPLPLPCVQSCHHDINTRRVVKSCRDFDRGKKRLSLRPLTNIALTRASKSTSVMNEYRSLWIVTSLALCLHEETKCRFLIVGRTLK